MFINKGSMLKVFTVSHMVYSGLFVAGGEWTIWL